MYYANSLTNFSLSSDILLTLSTYIAFSIYLSLFQLLYIYFSLPFVCHYISLYLSCSLYLSFAQSILLALSPFLLTEMLLSLSPFLLFYLALSISFSLNLSYSLYLPFYKLTCMLSLPPFLLLYLALSISLSFNLQYILLALSAFF